MKMNEMSVIWDGEEGTETEGRDVKKRLTGTRECQRESLFPTPLVATISTLSLGFSFPAWLRCTVMEAPLSCYYKD